ncbi:MAG TPA: transcriptional repressor [Candidatus Anaerostipes excrementavium]|uniref:Transcriptional repressor n=1 Tax=Candidatus Anaerostipes excrementavium TaxID=2838463 RepID=A0A9D2BAU5_9FIRM|nr:transcriptional repressor [uncultured Anaerostipes sp.]HIX68637.1 transcriptional repressor [Candidatus Anaerostipes excrementavium]
MQPAIKRSKQRDAIVAFLMTRKDHPTADTIYMNIKEEFPNISLGTVYRNLALLSERGDIIKLSYDGGADRYDASVKPHYHFICQECGEVTDIEIESFDQEIIDRVNKIFPGEIRESVTYFRGTCEKCLRKNLDKES